jgi:hypothetical protein
VPADAAGAARAAGDPAPVVEPEPGPAELLGQALDALAAAGILTESRREAAALTAWASVHGLSQLLLGPMAGLPDDAREHLLDACLRNIARGLVDRD